MLVADRTTSRNVNWIAVAHAAEAAAARGWPVVPGTFRFGERWYDRHDDAAGLCPVDNDWRRTAITDPDQAKAAWSVAPYSLLLVCGQVVINPGVHRGTPRPTDRPVPAPQFPTTTPAGRRLSSPAPLPAPGGQPDPSPDVPTARWPIGDASPEVTPTMPTRPYDRWRDADATPIPAQCRIEQLEVHRDHGALRSRLHQQGQVLDRGKNRLTVRCNGQNTVVSIRPHLVRVLTTPGGG